jgi:3-oxoadipate enol-lactonase
MPSSGRSSPTMTAERVVLLHSGVSDSRMWGRQARLLDEGGYEVVAPDLPGFGTEPAPGEPFSFVERIGELLPAVLVGNSFGGRIALETALVRPHEVPKLVLVDATIADHDWSEAVRAYWQEEEELLERGDVDGATELTLSFFVQPHVRDVVRPMQRRAYELQLDVPEVEVRWPAARPLSELAMPTLVLVGEHDHTDWHSIAQRIAQAAPDARLEVVPGAGHLPSLEEPAAFDRLLLEFLEG